MIAPANSCPPSRLPRLVPTAAAVAALAALVALTTACGAKQPTGPAGAIPVPVTLGKVVQKTVAVTFRAIGHVEPIETVAVKARIGGELLEVHFREGQAVHAGDTLFTIDPRQYEAALRQAEAQLARDEALEKKAGDDVTRYAGLVQKDFVTREQYDQILATAASLKASVTADQAAVDNARLQLAYCTITAPVEGQTGSLAARVGNLIKANDDNPMVVINRIRPIYASFSVPSQYLPSVLAHRAAGIKVLATLPEGGAASSEGTLTFVDNAVDTSTSTILLKATFPNQDERLWPGQFVDVTVILGEEPDRVVVPAAAVQTSQKGQYVFVVKDDQTVEMRPVKVARMDETEAVIDDGLTAGETVVTDGQLRLMPGAKIEAKEPAQGGNRT